MPAAASVIVFSKHVGDGDAVFRGLQQRGVIVRPMRGYRMPEWIRVSVGTMAENRRFVQSLQPLV